MAPSPVSLTSLLSSSTALLSSWFFFSISVAETYKETADTSYWQHVWNILREQQHYCYKYQNIFNISYCIMYGAMQCFSPCTVKTAWHEHWAHYGISHPLNFVHLLPAEACRFLKHWTITTCAVRRLTPPVFQYSPHFHIWILNTDK